jgi:RND family efflux transporter MFP subunit
MMPLNRFAATFLLSSCLISHGNAADKAMAVSVVKPVMQEISTQAVGTGHVVPFKTVEISPRVSGKTIIAIENESGDLINQGQVLVEIDDQQAQNDLLRVNAQLASANSTLEAARAAFERSEALFATKAASKETLEQLTKELQAANSARDQAQADVDNAKLDLDMYRVQSPISGRILTSPANAGQLSNTSTALFTVALDNILEVEVKIPERKIAALKVGDKATVRTTAGMSEQAVLRKIEPVIDTETHLATLRLRLVDDTKLASGMFVTASVAAGAQKALTIPVHAITYKNGSPIVFVTQKGVAHERKIEVSTIANELAFISGELTETDDVITTGAGFLQDGNKVRIVQEAAK